MILFVLAICERKRNNFACFSTFYYCFWFTTLPIFLLCCFKKKYVFFVHVFCAIFHLPKIEISVCLLSCSIVTVCPIWIGSIINRYCRYFYIYRLQYVSHAVMEITPKKYWKKLYHPPHYLSRIVSIHIILPVVECCFYVFCVQRDIFYECIEIKYSKITYIFVI